MRQRKPQMGHYCSIGFGTTTGCDTADVESLCPVLLKVKVAFNFPLQHLESTNLLRPAVEASRRQLPLAEPPAQQVSVHLVQLTGERQEASAAVNLRDRREKT